MIALGALSEAGREGQGAVLPGLETRLTAVLPVVTALSVAVAGVPLMLGLGNASYLICVAVVVAVAGLFAAAEPPGARRLFLSLFVLGFLLRLVLLVAVFHAALGAGGPFLGPDSTQFYQESRALAAVGYRLGVHPISLFETYDVAHYYVYAFLVRTFEADLFALQVFNCGLTALAAPLLLALGRHVIPRYAVALALVVAVNPSLMVLSIKDLLKDPSILFALSAAVWSVVQVCGHPRLIVRVGAGIVAAAALCYLHMDRFYVAAYLQMAAVTVLAVLWWRRSARLQWGAAAALVLIFASAEIVPLALGWPSTPAIMLEQVRFVGRTSGMLVADTGLAERVVQSRLDFRRETAKLDRGVQVLSPTGDAAAVPMSGTMTAVSFVLNAVRRFFGPFVWVPPAEWSTRHLLSGDYLLYPGTLMWYLVLPLALAGGVRAARRLAAAPDSSPLLLGLMAFCAIYFLQYLLINLSYRQRDIMFPLIAVFACLGASAVLRERRWRRAILIYLLALASFAVVHLIARSVFA